MGGGTGNLYSIGHYRTVQCSTVWCSEVHCSTVKYNTLHYQSFNSDVHGFNCSSTLLYQGYFVFFSRHRYSRVSISQYTRRYSQLRGPTSSSCGGLRPWLFLPFGQKIDLIMLFWPNFGNFWCSVVTIVTFSSNLSNFETKKSPKISTPKKF